MTKLLLADLAVQDRTSNTHPDDSQSFSMTMHDVNTVLHLVASTRWSVDALHHLLDLAGIVAHGGRMQVPPQVLAGFASDLVCCDPRFQHPVVPDDGLTAQCFVAIAVMLGRAAGLGAYDLDARPEIGVTLDVHRGLRVTVRATGMAP